MLEASKSSFGVPSFSPPPPSSSSQFYPAGGSVPYTPSPFSAGDNSAFSQPQPPQQPPQPQQDERLYKGVHPFAAFFHVAFKISALLTFILGNIFSSAYIMVFVITILFLAADFWTTKNVSGRLLVCLRWWNDVREDGSTEWIFESAPDADSRVNGFDRWFFWLTTAGNCAVWALLVIFNLMSLSRLPMAVIGLVLGGANFVGFLKCSRDAKKRVTQFMLNQVSQHPDLLRQAANVV